MSIFNLFNLHLELRAVRKIRLRYSESDFHASVYHMSSECLSHFASRLGRALWGFRPHAALPGLL
jgi:hypothetical protein